MATQTIRALHIAFSPYPNVWEAYEADGAAFSIGDVVVFTASGMIREMVETDPTSIAGLALRAGQNRTSGALVKTQFAPLYPGTIVEGNLVTAATGDLTVRATGVGTLVGLIKRTTESDAPWAFDWNERTNVQFRIVGLKDASGDVNARVYCVVLASTTAFGGSQDPKAD